MSKWIFFVRLAALLLVTAALAAPSAALAGGWVVITLDQLPEQIEAGQPYTLGMMARQHGRTPWEMDSLNIEARHVESGQVVTFTAMPQGQPGHYQAELVFPEAGQWEWGVASGLYPDLQPMPTLRVVAAQPAAAGSEPAAAVPATNSIPLIVGGVLAALAFAAGVALIARNPHRRPQLLAGVGMLVLCGVLVFGLFSTANAQARQAKSAAADAVADAGAAAEVSAEETGRHLFLAKGCVVCHVNDRVLKNSATYGVTAGPNLTVYRNDPEYLHSFLKDPQSMKPGTEMPNLELKREEIEALISFINAGN